MADPKIVRIPVLVNLVSRLKGHGPHTQQIRGELLGGGSLLALKDANGEEHWYPVAVAERIDPVRAQ